MKFEYQSATSIYADDRVTSVASDGKDVLIFTDDYGTSHHKYLITGNILRRYEQTCSFFHVMPVRSWRVSA